MQLSLGGGTAAGPRRKRDLRITPSSIGTPTPRTAAHGDDRLASSDLAELLAAIEGRPLGEYGKSENRSPQINVPLACAAAGVKAATFERE